MTDNLWTIMEINAAVALLFGILKLVQRRLSFVQQRWTLLALPVLAVIAVLVKKTSAVADAWSYRVPVIVLDPVNVSAHTAGQEGSLFTAEMIYRTGVLLFGAWFLWKLGRVLWLFLRAERRREAGFIVTE